MGNIQIFSLGDFDVLYTYWFFLNFLKCSKRLRVDESKTGGGVWGVS